MKSKAKNWGWISTAPIWYINNKGTKEIDLDAVRAPFIKKAFQLRLLWYSFREIAEYLFEKWFRSVHWNKVRYTEIDAMIKRKVYCWIIELNDSEIKWKHKRIIDLKTWENANKVNRRENFVQPDTYHFAFKWILTCWECWSILTAERKTKILKTTWKKAVYIYYRCKKNKWIKCGQSHIKEDDLELEFLNELETYQISEEFYNLAIRALKDKTEIDAMYKEDRIKALDHQLIQLNIKEKKLLDLRLDDKIMQWPYEEKNKEISLEKLKIQEDLSKSDHDIRKAYENALRTVELLKSPYLYWKERDYKNRGILQKIIWSNCTVLNGKVHTFAETELFKLIKSSGVGNGSP